MKIVEVNGVRIWVILQGFKGEVEGNKPNVLSPDFESKITKSKSHIPFTT
jgi:hypothetical protein